MMAVFQRPIGWIAQWIALLGVVLGLLGAALPAAAQDAAAEPAASDAAVLAPLLDVLEDPEARARLIDALRAPAAEGGADATAAAVPEEERATFAARLAELSLESVATVIDRAETLLNDILALRVLPGLLTPERLERISTEGVALLLTIAVTVTIFRALLILSRRLLGGRPAAGAPVSAVALTFVAQVALRLAGVFVAWVAGYGLAYFVFGAQGVALPQALYLNAFVIFGLFTVALSTLVSPHPEDLTFADLPQRTEGIIYRNVRRVAGVACYGLIAAVPIAQAWTNFVVARSLRTILLTLFALFAAAAIHRIARALRRDEAEAAARSAAAEGGEAAEEDELSEALAASSTRAWNAIWPWLGYAYVAVAYIVSMANPNLLVDLVGRATLYSALALVALLFGLRLFRLAPRGMRAPVPRSLAALLPTLSDRLSGFATPTLIVGGLVSLAVSALLLLEGWRVIDLRSWGGGGASEIAWRAASLALLFALLILFWAVLSSFVDKKLSAELPEDQQVSARSRTLLALFRNTVSIALVIFGGMTLLSEIGVDIAPLLAGAGVIGLAIGFGAQKLVQDIITGVFIQLENAINEGDVITVAGISGVVEKLTIRSVGIRDLSATYHIIPFSAVDTVSNFMRGFGFHVEVVGVAYDSDLDVVKKALHDAFDAVAASEFGADITAPLDYHGVIGLGDSSVNLRARVRTKPGKQWGVGRAYTQAVKRALDAAGVEIPFPHRELKLPPEMMRLLAPQAPAASANSGTAPDQG